MALDAQEMTDALDYQSELWGELAKYLQGTWKGLAEASERFRLDPTFISEVGLAAFLPICAGGRQQRDAESSKSACSVRNDDLRQQARLITRINAKRILHLI